MVASTKPTKPRTPRTPAQSTPLSKKPAVSNTSILKFFKKTEKQEGSLFVGAPQETTTRDDIYGDEDAYRFNEHESPVKKRRLIDHPDPAVLNILSKVDSSLPSCSAGPKVSTEEAPEIGRPSTKSSKPRIFTPFVIGADSDEEEDEEETGGHREERRRDGHPRPSLQVGSAAEQPSPTKDGSSDLPERSLSKGFLSVYKSEESSLSLLKREESTYPPCNDVDDYPDMEEVDLDTFEGEEMREMRFMREQARIEAEEQGTNSVEELGDEFFEDGSTIRSCPICDGSLVGISPDDATRHVNFCLDGNPTFLPNPSSSKLENNSALWEGEANLEKVSQRFIRAAQPRPGQRNPLELDRRKGATESVFSKLMSNNAEDIAWATAAAAEHASRGRPAYERTCPFYKIMPGFSICVDAFRYGAVEGCKAYFLSHFHSDHYVGLTANWRHGPIYCSKVTGSLVRQQLRTAAKWVVELEFEKFYDVPGTGATVFMLPANHCPGSSLFVFEKAENAGQSRRVKRILHCGDFRACPGQVGHPLLKPSSQDLETGKLTRQKIDICYLDTTYLNPRYSFPPQEDVIRASAELCASLSPDPDCKDHMWESSTKALGTSAVSSYFQKTGFEEKGSGPKPRGNPTPAQRLLVICGTYSIGKERICVAIAKALGSKIFASPGKIKICKQLGDPELTTMLTSDPVEAQVHMQMLMEIRAETLQEYLNSYKPHFSRIVGFRPSGWNFRSTNGKSIGANTPPSSIPTQQILHSTNWRTRFERKDFVAQRGSTKEAMCFGVPYSEHSSFRELAMFVMGLNIDKIIPTVNVGSEQSRKRMKGWLDRWMAERRKGGLVRPLVEGQDDEGTGKADLWLGKSGKGGGVWW